MMGEFIGQGPESTPDIEATEKPLLDRLVEDALERFREYPFKWAVGEDGEIRLKVYDPWLAATDAVENCGIDTDELFPTLMKQTSLERLLPNQRDVTRKLLCCVIVERELSTRHPEIEGDTAFKHILPIAG